MNLNVLEKKIKIRFLILSPTLSNTFWQKSLACNESEMKEDLPDHFYNNMLEMKESLVLELRLNTSER